MTTEELTAEITALEDRLDKVAKLDDHVERNRRGVELHQKIKRAKTELDRLDPPADDALKGRVRTLANRILTDVFEIDARTATAEHIYYSVRVSFDADAPIAATRNVKDTIIAAFGDNPHVVQVTVKQSSN